MLSRDMYMRWYLATYLCGACDEIPGLAYAVVSRGVHMRWYLGAGIHVLRSRSTDLGLDELAVELPAGGAARPQFRLLPTRQFTS